MYSCRSARGSPILSTMVRVVLSFDTSLLLPLPTGWTVNFNMSLSTFEPNLQTLKHLIDLALLSPRPSPPRLVFVSSVGVLART